MLRQKRTTVGLLTWARSASSDTGRLAKLLDVSDRTVRRMATAYDTVFTDAVMDDQLTGTAYPVQRLQDVQVEVPARTVSQSTVPVNLRPVWPSGVDEVNSLLRSPSTGQPSVLLTAVAGGKQGVRLSDGCSGALKVSADGLLVTALTIAPECRVAARVGNFTYLKRTPEADPAGC